MREPQAVDPWSLTLPDSQILCCGRWHRITRLPLPVPCCGRIWRMQHVVTTPVVTNAWWPLEREDAP